MGALACLALAACGGASHSDPPQTTTTVSTASKAPVTTTHAVSSPSPALVQLQAALAAQLKAAGPDSGVVVYDLTAKRVLYALRSTIARPPASVEKLYTTAAVLQELGPAAELQTTVLGSGHLGPGGVWEGDLYLRGGGDPTFGDGTFNRAWEDGYGPTAQELVAQLRRDGIRSVTGRVIGDPSIFDSLPGGPNTGGAPDIPDIGGELAGLTYDHGASTARLAPGPFAARELVLTMRGAGIEAKAAKSTATAPDGAPQLAVVDSPPMSVLLTLMDVPSDDFFAEMLTKQLGVRFSSGGTTAAGAAVLTSVIAELGDHPAIVDGSGLSRRDGSSPDEVVDLLRAVWGTPTGTVLQASLPVVGVNGTVREIALHSPAHGRCSAKTGTLNYVTNLAGYCASRGGHELAFAVFIEGPTNSRGYVLVGRVVAAVARY
jgi:D-alanyl-D-alanine carboxypeptidase/D-alanyl-D-alanine-endopeptidase (penicillin-binding protein 4)